PMTQDFLGFVQHGGVFVTAEELAQYGADQVLKTFPFGSPEGEREMMVIPAIDVKDGRCVRLRQGDMAAETVYSDDVAAMARRWEEAGARMVHLVDLHGAVEGEPKNF